MKVGSIVFVKIVRLDFSISLTGSKGPDTNRENMTTRNLNMEDKVGCGLGFASFTETGYRCTFLLHNDSMEGDGVDVGKARHRDVEKDKPKEPNSMRNENPGAKARNSTMRFSISGSEPVFLQRSSKGGLQQETQENSRHKFKFSEPFSVVPPSCRAGQPLLC